MKEFEKESVRKTAVALSYDPDEDAAPKIVATGRGLVADTIIERAGEANVPIHKDEKLAGTLSKLEIGDSIPPQLYGIVAEILVYVDNMEHLKSKLNRDK